MIVSDVAIRRGVTTIIFASALIIFGWLSFSSMGINLFPNIEFPYITVSTQLVGASPEVMDQNVTDVIEEEIKTISGIRTIQSNSFEGASFIIIEFELSKDVDVAANEVRAKVNLAKQELPNDVEEPIVDKFDINATPIITLAVHGRASYSELAYYADNIIKERIQSATGVGKIDVLGFREREIRIWLDPAQLNNYNLTAGDIIYTLQTEHLELPGGRITNDQNEYTIKVEGEFPSIEALADLDVANRNGAVIKLKDVATVNDSFEDKRSIARYNGMPAIAMEVRPQSGANTVAVSDSVQKEISVLKETLPDTITIDIAFDLSDFIKDSMEGVQFDIMFGILLTALIMFAFLRNLRITFISIIVIPTSLIGAFSFMKLFDFSINNLTMLAMSLAVGLVIDDAIVVLENIFHRMETGVERLDAARKGTHEVTFPVLASTSTIIAVFLPVAFMKGLIGRFFFQFGLTVAITIAISTMLSLTLTPFLCSRLLRVKKEYGKLYRVLETFFEFIDARYKSILDLALSHRVIVIITAIIAFIVGVSLNTFIGSEFITESDESRFMVNFELPMGTPLEITAVRMEKLADILLERPEVQSIASSVGGGTGGEVNKGRLRIRMVPKEQREMSQQEFMKWTRENFKTYSDMIYAVEQLSSWGGRNAQVEYVIQGPTTRELAHVSNEILNRMAKSGVFIDYDADIRMTKPEVKIEVNRGLASDLGVSVQSIANEIYALFGGIDVAKFKDKGHRYSIRVKTSPENRDAPSDLENFVVKNNQGQLIKAPNLITQRTGYGPNVINRYNRRRAVNIYTNLRGDLSSGEGLEILEKIVADILPDDGNWSSQVSGGSKIFVESFQYMFQALILSILVIYMILAVQFESFVHPFTIMLSLPLTMIGVFGALLIFGKTLNIFSFIGIIMLMGLVTKNAILLVDYANVQRNYGVNKVEAMKAAGARRLRPILMTASSTILGVLPVALQLSEGGETRSPMAIAVIGGLITSSLLTLIVIPVVYVIFDNFQEWIIRQFNRIRNLRSSGDDNNQEKGLTYEKPPR